MILLTASFKICIYITLIINALKKTLFILNLSKFFFTNLTISTHQIFTLTFDIAYLIKILTFVSLIIKMWLHRTSF